MYTIHGVCRGDYKVPLLFAITGNKREEDYAVIFHKLRPLSRRQASCRNHNCGCDQCGKEGFPRCSAKGCAWHLPRLSEEAEQPWDPPLPERKWKMWKRRSLVENTERTPIPTPRVLPPCRRDADATRGPRAPCIRAVQEFSQLLAQHMAQWTIRKVQVSGPGTENNQYC
ncbi:unnamed protein product [Strongylus vulgaris]|uniref:Uncharacterized protein n=1 Tax=Strongylus vulgaris TaxID=40348 RepID=A0A3P7LAD7_STRVU|nr:unnamed protein product [Strongylus vulgaris]